MEKFILILIVLIVSITILTYFVYNYIYNKVLNLRLKKQKESKKNNLPRPLTLVNIVFITLLSFSLIAVYISEKQGFFIKDVMPKITGEFSVSYFDLNNANKKSSINVYNPFLIDESDIEGYLKIELTRDDDFTLILYLEDTYNETREFIVYLNYKGGDSYDKVRSRLLPFSDESFNNLILNEYEFSRNIAYKGNITKEITVELVFELLKYDTNENLYETKVVFRKQIFLSF
ncbi:MAG: hypothetical protein PHF62_01720 [Acholeplasmataceae bacterium]|nr:hypothetical protein [Acholeplasmataceae bacterium]MDD4203822.1 hypothetical protein [Acholeplasmataceae bacterium]MDD4468850.1 hypothetical protein [Acholeplasmataceae bacterium]MDD4823982.1 hypothetical protein [Acholeplasmataceae bacterium]MDY0316455.1 hypothetical protein [Acholeplasmatales bacterium]